MTIEEREDGSVVRRLARLRVDRMDGLRVDRVTVTLTEDHGEESS